MMRASLVVLLVGCSQRSAPAPPPEPGPPEHRDPPRKQLIHGATNGVVSTYDDGSLRLAIGDKATCEGVRAPEIELPHRLGPDGIETWTATSIQVGRVHATVTGDPHVTVVLGSDGAEIQVDLHAEGDDRFEAKGTVLAKYCPQRAPRFSPSVMESEGATMTIAGKRLPIRGAIRIGEDLVLSDAPRGCNPTWISGVTLSRTGGQWTLAGERIATVENGDGHGLVIKPDRARATIALSGKTTLGDYTVELAGTAEIYECAPQGKPAMTTKLEIGNDWARGPTSDTIGCVRTDRGGYCYAHLPDGTSVGCRMSDFMASYTSASDPYDQFDWDRNLLGPPGDIPECTGVQHFPSNPHPYIPPPPPY